MTRKKSQRYGLGLAVGLFTTVLAGCGSSATAAHSPAVPSKPAVGSSPSALTPVNVGLIFTTSDAGLLLAQKEGFFRQEGLKVSLKRFTNSATMISLLGHGSLQVGSGAVAGGLFNAVAHGVKINIVADKGHFAKGHAFEALVIQSKLVADGRWKGYQSLKGLKIAVSSLDGSPAFHLAEFAAKGGVTLKQIHIQVMPFPDMVAALANGSIDGAMIIEPELETVLLQHTAKLISTDYAIDPHGQDAVLMYSHQFEAQDPQAAQKFMVAYLKGVRLYNQAFTANNPKAKATVIKVLMAETAVKKPSYYQTMIMPAINSNGDVNMTSLQQQLNWYIQQGDVQGHVNLKQVVNLTYANRADKILGGG